MKKTVILTLVGLGLGAGGMVVGYFFLASIDNGTNFIFMLLSPILIVASVVCLVLATKPKKVIQPPVADPFLVKPKTEPTNTPMQK